MKLWNKKGSFFLKLTFSGCLTISEHEPFNPYICFPHLTTVVHIIDINDGFFGECWQALGFNNILQQRVTPVNCAKNISLYYVPFALISEKNWILIPLKGFDWSLGLQSHVY